MIHQLGIAINVCRMNGYHPRTIYSSKKPLLLLQKDLNQQITVGNPPKKIDDLDTYSFVGVLMGIEIYYDPQVPEDKYILSDEIGNRLELKVLEEYGNTIEYGEV